MATIHDQLLLSQLEPLTDDQLRAAAFCIFQDDMASLDYSHVELVEWVLNWADNGVVGFHQMTRQQLLAHRLDTWQSSCEDTEASVAQYLARVNEFKDVRID